MAKVIGIDLGTTNSVVAVMEGGEPIIITNAEGSRLTPSVVAFSKDGERMVGQVARRQAITNPERTVLSVKRQMGSNHRSRIDDKGYTPQEISAMVLQKLKNDAEAYLGEKVNQAVITVPAYFSDSQRQATKDAGVIAGLEVLRIINEPTAAALAYGLDKGQDQTILVFDLGGGTFDVSLLELGDGVFEVKATSGNTKLGGDDFDQRIIDYVAAEFKKEQGIDLTQDKMALQRLKEAAEKAKIELSSLLSTTINLPFITADASGPRHLEISLTRAKFEELTRDLVEASMGPTRQALADAGLKPLDVDKILLVGGSTRIPSVQEAITSYFGKEPHKGINPDECVAMGAAIQAGVGRRGQRCTAAGRDPALVRDRNLGGVFTKIIERNTTIPTAKSQIFSTAADGQTGVEIHVLQGERAMAANNKTLGRFELTGIPPAPRGVPKIEVTFDIDANGIVHVSAKDLGTGKEQSITIKSSSGLSDEEIERMRKEADLHAAEDEERRQAIEARNQADALVYSAEKTVKEAEGKVDKGLIDTAKEATAELKEKLKSDDPEVLKKASEKLSEALYAISSALYAKSQEASGQQTGDPGSETKTDDNVVDADYKVEDDKK